MPANVNLRQTTHAVERWRQRVTPDEGPSHIALAFAAAATVPKGEALPFPRTPDTTYHRHATLADIYFVTQACHLVAGALVLVTVIDAGELWGVKRSRQKADLPLPTEWVEQEHATMQERRAWLQGQLAEAHAMLRWVNTEYCKGHPVRRAWVDRVNMITSLVIRAKRAQKGIRRAELAAEAAARNTPEAQSERLAKALQKYRERLAQRASAGTATQEEAA